MAIKRKTRTSEATQPTEPEQQPEPQPELEPVHEEINETLEVEEEDPNVEEEEEVIEDEEEEEEEEEEEQQEEENPNDDMMDEEHKSDAVAENNEPETQTMENPSEIASNGVEQAEKQNEEELEEEPLEKVLEPFTKDQLTLLLKESVSKHPDLIENVHKLADADPAHRKIFVHGLGWEASSETITSVFGKYGEIEDCKVVKDKISGKSKGYGFILFKHRSGARRALKEPQKLIEGRMTSCQLASAGPVQAPPPTVVSSVSTPPATEYTQRKIFVSNVSAELDPNKLLEYFSQFGEIEEGPLGLDKQTGKPRGFCLFVYKSVESAKKALEDPHKNYEGQTLHCQKAVDGPKHGKGGHFQQHGGHHHQGHQGGYHHPAKKGRYSGGSGHAGGHLMAPSGGSPMPSMGFNPGVAPAAIGQAVAALLASQGAGLGIGNLLGGMGVNQQGAPQMMNNAGYGGQGGAGGYGGQPGVQGGYGGQQQMGQPGVRPHQGGAPYMGHGR